MNKSLVIGGVNPVHYGHIALMKAGLRHSDSLDFLIGTKPIYLLPYEIRKRALELVLCNEGLQDRVRVIEGARLAEIDTTVYDSLVLGSDVLNHFHPSVSIHRNQDKTFFRGFKSLIVLQRTGNPVTQDTIDFVSNYWKYILCPEQSPVSAKEIRKRYRAGSDFSTLLPIYVQALIQPYLHLLDESTF